MNSIRNPEAIITEQPNQLITDVSIVLIIIAICVSSLIITTSFATNSIITIYRRGGLRFSILLTFILINLVLADSIIHLTLSYFLKKEATTLYLIFGFIYLYIFASLPIGFILITANF